MSEDAQNLGSAAPPPDPASGDFEGLERAGETLGQALGGVLARVKRLMAAPRPAAGAGGEAGAEASALGRADRLVSSAAGKLGDYSYGARQRIRRTLARAREEVEDVWAEAEAVRRSARGGEVGRGTPAEGESAAEDWEEASESEGRRQPPAPRGG